MVCFEEVKSSDNNFDWLCSSDPSEEVSYPGTFTTAEGDSGFCDSHNIQVRTCPATLETTAGTSQPTDCWDRKDTSNCQGVKTDGYHDVTCDEPYYR